MRAYSTGLKECLVRAVADGLPMREAARRFDVAVTTVKRAVAQQRTTGMLVRKPIPGHPRVLGGEQEALLEHCAWWAEQTGQQLSQTTMWRALHRLGWTHK